MPTSIITTEDLYEFKLELLEEIKQLLQPQNGTPAKKWLKSPEVMKLLGVSPSTLQNMRINGTIPYTKIGGILYYDYHEIMSIFDENRVHNKL